VCLGKIGSLAIDKVEMTVQMFEHKVGLIFVERTKHARCVCINAMVVNHKKFSKWVSERGKEHICV